MKLTSALLSLACVLWSAGCSDDPAESGSAEGASAGTGGEPAEAGGDEESPAEEAEPAAYAALEGFELVNASTFGDWAFGGQPSEADLEALKALGITKIVDLRMPSEDRGYDEAAACAELDLEYVGLPFSPRDFEDATVDAILAELEEGGKTLVHCASGNRVQLMFSMHRVLSEGADLEEAIAGGRANGMSEGSEALARKLLLARLPSDG